MCTCQDLLKNDHSSQVDIVHAAATHATMSADEAPMYVVQFALLAGPVRRFRRLVDHLTSVLQASQQRLMIIFVFFERENCTFKKKKEVEGKVSKAKEEEKEEEDGIIKFLPDNT